MEVGTFRVLLATAYPGAVSIRVRSHLKPSSKLTVVFTVTLCTLADNRGTVYAASILRVSQFDAVGKFVPRGLFGLDAYPSRTYFIKITTYM